MKLTRLNSPSGGAVSALVSVYKNLSVDPVQEQQTILFAATSVGIFRWTPSGNDWQILPNSPIGVICMASSSPQSSSHFILAGTTNGILISEDLGETWAACHLPISHSTILCIQFSPDGSLVLAGSLEDGIFASSDDGHHWETRNFGLLDQSVFTIAFSNGYAQDTSIYIGAETSVYFSYNQARAWKEMPFNEDSLPSLSMLSISPQPGSPILFLGTESNGLFKKFNSDTDWKKLSLPANTINSLVISNENILLAATEQGIFQSTNFGETWIHNNLQPEALCLHSDANGVYAGWAEAGVCWLAENKWKETAPFWARTFTDLLLSDKSQSGQFMAITSLSEGLWASQDGGVNWECFNPLLPFENLYMVDFSPSFSIDGKVIAATGEGVWLSKDSARNWVQLQPGNASLVKFSPDGKLIYAVFPGQGLGVIDEGNSREIINGPWQKGGQILELHSGPRQQLILAFLEGIGEEISFWQGTIDNLEIALRVPSVENPVVSIWHPPSSLPDRPWYASLGHQVWQLSARRTGIKTQTSLLPDQQLTESIVGLTGIQKGDLIKFFACTNRRVYTSNDGGSSWKTVLDFSPNRAIKMVPAPDESFFFLMRGGSLYKSELSF